VHIEVTLRSAPGQRAAASHTAAAAAPPVIRQALFEQAGIVATASFGELLNVAVLMASQPVPAGTVVAIVSNGGGPVDTTAAVSPEAFGEALHIAAADDGVAALIAIVVRSASAGRLPVLTVSRLPVPACERRTPARSSIPS